MKALLLHMLVGRVSRDMQGAERPEESLEAKCSKQLEWIRDSKLCFRIGRHFEYG